MKMNKKGFTITELLVAVIIISVLASIAIPRFASVLERGRSGDGVEILTALYNAQQMHFYENGAFATNVANLDVEILVSDSFQNMAVFNPGGAGYLAVVRRTVNGNTYNLMIDNLGNVECNGTGTFAQICGQMSYPANTYAVP